MDLLHMDMPVLAGQQELNYISSVQTQDVVCTNRLRGTDRERESQGNLCTQHDLMMINISNRLQMIL